MGCLIVIQENMEIREELEKVFILDEFKKIFDEYGLDIKITFSEGYWYTNSYQIPVNFEDKRIPETLAFIVHCYKNKTMFSLPSMNYSFILFRDKSIVFKGLNRLFCLKSIVNLYDDLIGEVHLDKEHLKQVNIYSYNVLNEVMINRKIEKGIQKMDLTLRLTDVDFNNDFYNINSLLKFYAESLMTDKLLIKINKMKEEIKLLEK